MYENINEILKKDIILQGIGTARKNIFSFSKYSEKIVFPQNCTGIWPFLYHQDWWYFFSLKTWSYSLDVKWKMICLKKYLEILYFLQMFWNDALSKKIAVEYDLSCIIREDGFFFSRKYDFFSMDEKWKMIFLKKYMEIWCFLYIRWRWYFFFPQPWNYLSVKKAKMIFSWKIHLRMTFPASLKKMLLILKQMILAF